MSELRKGNLPGLEQTTNPSKGEEKCQHGRSVYDFCPKCEVNEGEQSELDKAIEEFERALQTNGSPRYQCCWLVLTAAKRSQELQEEHDKEVGEFQNQVRNLIMKMAPTCNPDGAGCESGDWRDFTLSEIGQGMAHVIDKCDELQQQLRDKDELIERLVEVAQRVMKCAHYAGDECECIGPYQKALHLAREQGYGKAGE